MPFKIGGKTYTEQELLRHCSDVSALYSVRRMTLHEGKAEGMRVIEVRTTQGLRCLLSEERCLDPVLLEYRGVNIGYLCKNGLLSNRYSNPEAGIFEDYWSGGAMATCGLRNTGPDCRIGEEFFPPHGRIGLTPAAQVCARVEDGNILISGIMRETHMYGHCLEMTRTWTIPIDGASMRLRDVIHNQTPNPETLFLLYHFNFSFPFLGANAQVRFPTGDVIARTEEARAHISEHSVITEPIDNAPEQVFFHITKEKTVTASVTNVALGIRAELAYDSADLPVLTEWKSMASGDYALGIEPGTSFIRGRADELKAGGGLTLPGYAKKAFEVELRLGAPE